MASKRFMSILLPTSLTADASNLKQKTLKIGQVGRTLAIFRVNQVCIYNDDDQNVGNQEKETTMIETILRYMDTPQYLRKQLFPRMNELRYAGLLPPLRTPHHPLKNEKMEKGDYREATVLEASDEGSFLNIGLEEKGFTSEELEPGARLTIRLGESKNEDKRVVTPADRGEVNEYWGFKTTHAEALAEGLSKSKADYFIGTSRRGQSFYEAVEGIKSNDPKSVAVAFGGPYQGLFEICERQNVDPDELFDVIINTIPDQGVETVRTEEALTTTLALLNALTGSR